MIFNKTLDLWYDIYENEVKNKNILLSRKKYYSEFYKRMGSNNHFIVTLKDIDGNHFDKLSYYIDTASIIHINLQGVTAEELNYITKQYGHKANWELVKPGIKNESGDTGFVSILSWEINHVYWTNAYKKAFWHYTNSYLEKNIIYNILKDKIKINNIIP